MLNEREFDEWLLHPVTIEFKKRLAAKRDELRRGWESTDISAFSKNDYAFTSAADVGYCNGLRYAEEFNFEQYETELGAEDDKPIRTPSPGSSSAS